MAYLRYSATCQWYVFEQVDGRLAIWHKDYRANAGDYSDADVREMLRTRDFSQIPGYLSSDEGALSDALGAWLREREQDHAN